MDLTEGLFDKISQIAGSLAKVMSALPSGLKALPLEKKYGRTFVGDWRGNVQVKLKSMRDAWEDSKKEAEDLLYYVMSKHGGTLGKPSSGGLMSGSEPATKDDVMTFANRVAELTGVKGFARSFRNLHSMASKWFKQEKSKGRDVNEDLSPRMMAIAETLLGPTKTSHVLESIEQRTSSLLESIEARIDPEDDLSGPDIGEAIVVVLQAVKAGYQGQQGVPSDVVASRAHGYLRDMNLVTQAVEELLDRGSLLRGQDGELYVS